LIAIRKSWLRGTPAYSQWDRGSDRRGTEPDRVRLFIHRITERPIMGIGQQGL